MSDRGISLASGFARCGSPRLEAEEDRPRPAGAGDRAGDLRQGTVVLPLPHKAVLGDENLVDVPLPLPQQLGPRFEMRSGGQYRLTAPACLLGDSAQSLP